MSADFTQAEADALFALEKHRVDMDQWNYPGLGSKITIPLISTDKHESFLLDLRRSRFVLARGTYQTRCRQILILARLDFGGTPHRNPDGEKVGSTHLHLYRQGFGDKMGIFNSRKLLFEFTGFMANVRRLHAIL